MTVSDKDNTSPRFARPSDLCTESGYTFMHRQSTIFDHFLFTVRMASQIDKQRLIAARALATSGQKEDIERLEKVEKNKDMVFDKVKKFSEYNSEVLCIRIVDNFLCYLSETIQKCMLKRPEMLKSSEMVRIEEILNFSRKADIVRFLVDRKINELSYSGISGIRDFLDSRTGIILSETNEEWSLLTISVELRNIYTHNRGKVNDLFLRRIGEACALIGAKNDERFHADFPLIVNLANNLFEIERRLDEKVARKFKIRRMTFAVWHGRSKSV